MGNAVAVFVGVNVAEGVTAVAVLVGVAVAAEQLIFWSL